MYAFNIPYFLNILQVEDYMWLVINGAGFLLELNCYIIDAILQSLSIKSKQLFLIGNYHTMLEVLSF